MYEENVIRGREELSEQIKALKELKKLGEIYGFDISRPAQNVQEAIQWLYFGYLAAIKEQNGAAMSLGRTSTFLDIYAESVTLQTAPLQRSRSRNLSITLL